MLDGVARGDGSVGEALAYVASSGTDITLADIIACRVEITGRAGTRAIAAGKRERNGQKTQPEKFHVKDSFSAVMLLCRA
jgi:hypothetical protein